MATGTLLLLYAAIAICALIVLIARDDPLDTSLVHHPAALLDKPIERIVIDPGNPYVLSPQLLCAASELLSTPAEVRMWDAEAVAEALVDDGLLRAERLEQVFADLAPGSPQALLHELRAFNDAYERTQHRHGAADESDRGKRGLA